VAKARRSEESEPRLPAVGDQMLTAQCLPQIKSQMREFYSQTSTPAEAAPAAASQSQAALSLSSRVLPFLSHSGAATEGAQKGGRHSAETVLPAASCFLFLTHMHMHSHIDTRSGENAHGGTVCAPYSGRYKFKRNI